MDGTLGVPHASGAVLLPPVVDSDPPGDITLSHSVDVFLSLVKPASRAVTTHKRKRAVDEQKFGPIEVNLATGFDGAFTELAQLLGQTAAFFDITSAQWRFMTPGNAPTYPLRDTKAFSFLAKQVHTRATARTRKETDILIRVCPRPGQVHSESTQSGQVCFCQFYILRLSNGWYRTLRLRRLRFLLVLQWQRLIAY